MIPLAVGGAILFWASGVITALWLVWYLARRWLRG